MTAIGADPEALEALARGLRSTSGELEATLRRLEVTTARVSWSGPDADRFRRSWQTVHRRALRDSAVTCATLARRIDLHAAQQRRASLDTGTPSAPGRRTAPPARVTVLHGTVAGSIGVLSGSLSGKLEIEDLGRRRRVTYTDDVAAGLGVAAGGGGRVSWNDHVMSSGATAGANIGLGDRVTRTWVLDAAALPMLLTALAAEQGFLHSPAGAMAKSVTRAANLLDAAGDALGIDLPGPPRGSGSALPAPQRTEELVGVVVSAAAWAAAPSSTTGFPGGAEGSITTRFSVGTAQETGRRSLLFEAEGSAAAAVLRSSPLLMSTREHLVGEPGSIRVEVPVGTHRRDPVVITLTRRDDQGEEVVRVAVDPSAAPGAAAAARRAVEHLRDGDGAGAVRSLAGLRAPLASMSIEVSNTGIDGDRVAAEGVGAVASLTVDGTVEHRSPRP